jgi:ABC-type transporter Mla subunit MlaD
VTDSRAKRERRVPSWAIGLMLVVVLAIASVYAFTKQVPWHNGYEVKAVFASAQNLRPSSPVRIAGVEVGKVTSVEHLTSAETEDVNAQAGDTQPTLADGVADQQAAIVTMELSDDARPVRTDATFKLRPRLFLEGNYFVDMEPGSPNAGEVDDGFTFPVNQTSYSVQLDQVLTTLQSDVRKNLQVLLNQFGNALIKHGGAQGFRELYRTSPPSYKFTSQVNEALLGTQSHDLSGFVDGLDRVVRGLGRNEQALQGFVTNLRIFSGSFAAEDIALGNAIQELPDTLAAAHPAFTNLNRSFPALRAFAREALPGTRSTPATLDAAMPFIHQVRELVSKQELRGLVADLRPTIPELATFSQRSIGFMNQGRALASCFNEVVVPWGNDTVDPPANYPLGTFGRVFETTGYGLEAISGESRSGDANGQYIRVEGGGGTNTVSFPAQPGVGRPEQIVGLTPFPITGSIPSFHPVEDSAKTPFKPQQPCERQEQPDLGATVGAVPQQSSAPAASPELRSLYDRYLEEAKGLAEVTKLREAGQDAAANRLQAQIGDRLNAVQDELEAALGRSDGKVG